MCPSSNHLTVNAVTVHMGTTKRREHWILLRRVLRQLNARPVDRDSLPHLAYLDRRPTSDGGLAPPRQCLVQVSGCQHPKTAYVLLGLCVRSVGDEPLTAGLRP